MLIGITPFLCAVVTKEIANDYKTVTKGCKTVTKMIYL